MKILYLVFIICLLVSCKSANLFTYNKIPHSGIYTYDLAFAEFGGRSLGANCLVEIIEDSITVIHNGGNLSGEKGQVIESGHIRWHKATKQWIIASSLGDENAPEVGGCSDGPIVVDFKKKKVWLC